MAEVGLEVKPGEQVAWLTNEQAARYLGFVREDGTANMNAFHVWRHRANPRRYKLTGGGLRFRRTDLDACAEPVVAAPPLRLVSKGGR